MAVSLNNFVRAQSDNLPKVDSYMLMQYIAANDCYNAAEIKGVKAQHSMRQGYVDSAIGCVQLQRIGDVCTVKGEICPEHKVRRKNYVVSMDVGEKDEEILHVTCHDCPASEGGCKHALAFLMWVHLKSTQPSPTEVECYWKKPKLAGVGTTIKFVTTKDFGSSNSYNVPGASNFLEQFLEAAKVAKPQPEAQLLKYYEAPNPLLNLSIHQMIISFVKGHSATSCFLEYASKVMEDKLCKEAEVATRDQNLSSMWHELRYGRITASKLYTAAHCKKTDGIFVEQVLGASHITPTSAMKRGQLLEKAVLKELEKETNKKYHKVGLLLISEHPELGASPDAVCDDRVVEIKCPSNEKTFKNYVLKNNKIAARYKAQIQLQMLAFKKSKGIFCVADPLFESSKKITIITEDFDQLYINEIVLKAKSFWKDCIYPRLVQTVK